MIHDHLPSDSKQTQHDTLLGILAWLMAMAWPQKEDPFRIPSRGWTPLPCHFQGEYQHTDGYRQRSYDVHPTWMGYP